jgi:hypothetical protein
MGSLLQTWALEQRYHLRVSVPYAPEAHDFRGQFRHPQRLEDSEYLKQFDYFVEMRVPKTTPVTFRRPKNYARFRRTWAGVKDQFDVVKRVRVIKGVELVVRRKNR